MREGLCCAPHPLTEVWIYKRDGTTVLPRSCLKINVRIPVTLYLLVFTTTLNKAKQHKDAGNADKPQTIDQKSSLLPF